MKINIYNLRDKIYFKIRQKQKFMMKLKDLYN